MTVRERRRRAEGDVTCIVGHPELRLPEDEKRRRGPRDDGESPSPLGGAVALRHRRRRGREPERRGGRALASETARAERMK